MANLFFATFVITKYENRSRILHYNRISGFNYASVNIICIVTSYMYNLTMANVGATHMLVLHDD